MHLGKRSCIERALELLKKNDLISLRYACLELRYCIEAICYEKAKLYRKQLPDNVIEKWQPRKLINALIEFDPFVNENFAINIWSEKPDGSKNKLIFSGTHKFLPFSILKKHYNKLGSYLHVPTILQEKKSSSAQKGIELRDYLLGIIGPIKESSENIIDSNVADTVSAYCQECNQYIIRNVESLKSNPTVVCTNNQCMAQYDVKVNKKDSIWKLREFDLECPICKSKYYYGLHLLKEGSVVKCDECHQEFVIHRQWVLFKKSVT